MASRDLRDALGGHLPEGFHFGDVLGMRRTKAIAPWVGQNPPGMVT